MGWGPLQPHLARTTRFLWVACTESGVVVTLRADRGDNPR